MYARFTSIKGRSNNMAVYKFSNGARGRPLSIDPDKLLAEMYKNLQPAKVRLTKLRTQNAGERAESLIGSETALPDSVNAALDVLEALRSGAQITYETARAIKKASTMVKQLSSPQARVYGRALSETLQEAYEADIKYLSDRNVTSTVTQHYLTELKNLVNTMTPQQRQSFLLSRGYQDPKTATQRYKRVKDWAEHDSGNKMTYAEAWAYTLYRRAIDVL